MASNVQRGVNRMDSGDWTRMLRLKGSVNGVSVTPNPPPVACCAANRNVKRYNEFGLSRIQKPASAYTDYLAANSVVYVLQTPADSCDAKAMTAYAICNNCSTVKDIVSHNGVCTKCLRIAS